MVNVIKVFLESVIEGAIFAFGVKTGFEPTKEGILTIVIQSLIPVIPGNEIRTIFIITFFLISFQWLSDLIRLLGLKDRNFIGFIISIMGFLLGISIMSPPLS